MPDWISVQEAAELSGYHPEQIRRLIRQGRIKAERKGAMFWIDHEALRAFLQTAEKARASDKRYGPRPRSKRRRT
jgi:excisionase family DNA binding protein